MSDKNYRPYILWKPCRCCKQVFFGELRLFLEPPGGFKEFCEDGMPAMEWIWTCNVEKDNDTLILTCGLTAPPPGSIKPMMRYGWSLAKHVTWARQRGPGLEGRTFEIPPP